MSEKNLLWLIPAKPEAAQFWILEDQPVHKKQNPIPSKKKGTKTKSCLALINIAAKLIFKNTLKNQTNRKLTIISTPQMQT